MVDWDDTSCAQLRALCQRTGYGPRHGAWALSVCQGDTERALQALVTQTHIEAMQARADAIAKHATTKTAQHQAQSWSAFFTDLKAIHARRTTTTPSIPDDIVTWMRDSVGLVCDDQPLGHARRLGTRGTIVETACPRVLERSPEALADALCLVADLYPIGQCWRRIEREEGVRLLSEATGYGLAIRRSPSSMQGYVVRAQRFFDLFDAGGVVLTNVHFRASGGRSWIPLSHHVFDVGIAVTTAHRIGIACVVDDD